MPEVLEIPDIPEISSMDMDGNALFVGRPRLGIDAEDLNGQLGSFFGAPEGEGILVRSVNSGSPAEKAGLKAGDVITSVDGERIRSTGDLRQKLAMGRTKEKDKDKVKEQGKDEEVPTRMVKLGVLRNRSEVSLSVELPEPHVSRSVKVISHRTNI
jgi:S1-C subfamily serine protease